MDDFDKIIRNAEQTYQTSATFVEDTMQQISLKPTTPKRGLRLWLPVLISGMAVIAVVIVASPLKGHFFSPNDSAITTSSNNQGSGEKSSSQQPTSAGTDDASLSSDLNGIGTAMNQESTDQNTANGALNDSAEQITVPTE